MRVSVRAVAGLWVNLGQPQVCRTRLRELAQLVTKSRSLVPRTPKQSDCMRQWKGLQQQDPASLTAALREAMELRDLSPALWKRLQSGPLRKEQLPVLDMRTLTALYYSICFFKTENLISHKGGPRKETVLLDCMLEEILSLDRFLQFDNRKTVSDVLLGMAMLEGIDREKLKRMSYKVMSRVKRLHPEALVDVLYAWAKMKWDRVEDLRVLSAEASLHKPFVSVHHLAKVLPPSAHWRSGVRVQGIWAWTQLRNEFDDHAAQFLTELLERGKLADLTVEDVALALSCAHREDLRDSLSSIVHHLFSHYSLAESKTSDLVSIAVALGKMDYHEGEALWQELSTYPRLSQLLPSDYISLWEASLHTGQSKEFIERLVFEAAQPEQRSQFSSANLQQLSHLSEQQGMPNMAQIFAEERLKRPS